MKLPKDLNILIVGLGLIGGSYARGFSKQGYRVNAIDLDADAIAYAKEQGMIECGAITPECELLQQADLCIFALYPHVLLEWIKEYGGLFRPGAVLSDVTGVKTCTVYAVQQMLPPGVEFVAAHPMAGREVYGVQNSDETIFYGANYIVVPTDANTFRAIELCKGIGETLGFARISALPPRAHDEMIGFVSQLTHIIAMCLMTCSKSEHLVDYTGDSFRDLTRIARINENMWSELFLLNKDALLSEIKTFSDELNEIYEILNREDTHALKEKMRLSTARRALFDKQ